MEDELAKALADLVNEAVATVDWIDQIRQTWGDEGVMRRRRDRLRGAIAGLNHALAPKPEVVDMNEIVRDWLAPKPEGGEGNTPYCASCADLVKALSRQRDHLERMRATGLWVAEQESALRDIRATLGLMPTPDAAKGEK